MICFTTVMESISELKIQSDDIPPRMINRLKATTNTIFKNLGD